MADSEIATLIEGLRSPDVGQRSIAAEALARLETAAQPAAVPLVLAVADEDENVREQATSALEGLGPPAVEDADRLAVLLAHNHADIAYWAATLLGRLGSAAAAAAPALAATLGADGPLPARERAAWALSQIGAPTPEVIATLQRAASGTNKRLARLAAEALEKVR